MHTLLRNLFLVESRFRDLLDAMPDAIVLVDLAGHIVFSNAQTTTLFGYTRHDLHARPVELLLDEHSRPYGSFADLRARSTDPNVELYGRRKDGTAFPVEISISALETKDGTLVSAAIRDITERKRFEQALHEKNVELEAANAELEAFDYSVAHDLRAPLDRIAGFTDMLGDQYGDKLGAAGEEVLQRILAASRNMDQLIADLLKLSTVTRGVLTRSAVDVSALAESIIADLRRSDPQRAPHFVVHPDMSTRADPGLLRVVLQNLLGNAWKFTRERAPPRIEMGCIDSRSERVFFVRDNGAGFDIANAEALFKPFRRLHSEDAFEGTGIGLATVQRIVRRHGGRVWAEARVGDGATFFFTLSGKSWPA